MIEYLFLIFAIPIHEFGHYIGFRFFNIKPKIRVTKYLAILMGENEMKELTGTQMAIVALLGILTGYVYLLFLGVQDVILLIYFLMSIFDIYILFALFEIKKEWRNFKLKNIELLQAKEILGIDHKRRG